MVLKAVKLALMASGAILWLVIAFLGTTLLLPPSTYSYSIDLAGTRPTRVMSIGCGSPVEGRVRGGVAEGREVASCEGAMFVLVRYEGHDVVCNVGYVDNASHQTIHSRFRIEGGRCADL
jgi:hypothetical protein